MTILLPRLASYLPRSRSTCRSQIRSFVSQGEEFKVLFVGAGNINFGSDEGPWNHSKRLEDHLGPRLKVLGIIDPATTRTSLVLQSKSQSPSAPAYAQARSFVSVQAAREAQIRPDAVIVGCPPAFRGTLVPGRNVETQVRETWPGVGILLEKPVSTGTVVQVREVLEEMRAGETGVVAVAYMLRYSKAVQKMKDIIKENGLEVMMTSARYVMAYEYSAKPAWWNKSIDCGPIVEQATHFVDLSRYFGGEVRLDSISAQSVEWYEKPGKLSKMSVNESLIPENDRIPRFTSAQWKYESGAIGHLEHGVALQGTEFSTEITVFADGYQLRLNDPYNRPTLYVRRPGSDAEEVHTFHEDDAFKHEIVAFCDAVQGKGKASELLLSSYEDAVRTYEMTWAIRRASEESRRLPDGFEGWR